MTATSELNAEAHLHGAPELVKEDQVKQQYEQDGSTGSVATTCDVDSSSEASSNNEPDEPVVELPPGLSEVEKKLFVAVGTCEKSELTIKQQQEGVAKILLSLSEEQKSEMPDKNMPLRHLRAEDGNVEIATQKLKATLKWRKEFGVEKIVHAFDKEGYDKQLRSILEKENETAKIYLRGYTNEGRAIMYMNPALENTDDVDNNMKHLVYFLERAIRCTEDKTKGKYEKIIFVQNYSGFKLRNAPPLQSSKLTLEILQNHYPERLYRSLCCNTPFIFRTFWALISPFVDPNTKQKIVLSNAVKKLHELVDDKSILEPIVGGTNKKLRKYNSKEYLRDTPYNQTFDE